MKTNKSATADKIKKIKKVKSLLCNFCIYILLFLAKKRDPCPPAISSQPWSTVFIALVPRSIAALVSGCEERGANSHIVFKKNDAFLGVLEAKSFSQKKEASNKPEITTKIVKLL